MPLLFSLVVFLIQDNVTSHVLSFRPQISCPSNLCPHDNTCCDSRSCFYACCPLPKATCCEDGATCCPGGFVCSNTQPKTCIQPHWLSDASRIHLTQATANIDRHTFMQTGSPESLNLQSTVGEADQRQEIISETDISATQNEERFIQEVTSVDEIEGDERECGDSVCMENHTCCNWKLQAMCCPFSDGVCCDDYYCCPDGYFCPNADKLRDCIPFRLIKKDESNKSTGVGKAPIQYIMVDNFGHNMRRKNGHGHLVHVMTRLTGWLKQKLQRNEI